MKKSMQSEIIILLLTLIRSGFGENGSRMKLPVKRSYQIPQVAVVNNGQGLQYYAAAPLYTIPTVLIPNQIGLSATPIANVVLPPSSDPKPLHEFQETSTPIYTSLKPTKIPVQFYKQKHRSHVIVQTGKRPASYVNSVYGHPVRMKPLTSIPTPKTKVSAVSIQPSVDISGQFGQEAASNLYPSTVGPPVASTYGPPKAVDFQYKTRVSGISGQTVYNKLKGLSHRHSYYPTKKVRVYSHVHKDHVHNHYLPSSHPLPVYKIQQPNKFSAPAYLPPAPSTPATFTQESTPTYPYHTSTHVRFPDNQEVKDQLEVQKGNYSPGDVTQAIIKNPGVINNYDANIPLHVPSKKPYQFEVNEILKNSELHFVQETPVNNNNPEQATVSSQNNGFLQYTQKVPYQNALVFNTHQPLYTPLTVEQSNIIAAPNPLDIYSLPGVNTYQSNHIVADQDLGTSETVKVPVAVIRGPHNIASQGMFGFTVKRQDSSTGAGEEIKKTFTPSKRTSDWIPMSGNGVPLPTEANASEKQSDASLESFSDEYFSPSNQPTKKETKIIRQPVGDIISGKIPEKYSPKTGREGDIVNGKISFVRNSFSEREKRKGSVIDVYPSASSEVLNPGDTSDLVVSSVIKFS